MRGPVHLRVVPRLGLFLWIGLALTGPVGAQQSQTPAQTPEASDSDPRDVQPGKPAGPDAKPAARSTAEDNPFPEDLSRKAQEAAAADEKADSRAAAAGAAGGDDAESSSSRDKFKDLDLLGERDPTISNGAGGVVVNTKLSDDDVRIGTLYMQTGNYQGAYERLKEAVAVNPDNPEAVFRLAEAARKLNRKDEALQNYQIYLAALPDGPRARNIRKALNEMAKK